MNHLRDSAKVGLEVRLGTVCSLAAGGLLWVKLFDTGGLFREDGTANVCRPAPELGPQGQADL